MLFRRTRGPLGLGINPAMKATANTALIHSDGTIYTAPTGPSGYTRWGINTLRHNRWLDDLARARAMQTFLEENYGTQILDASQIGSSLIKCNITADSPNLVIQGLITPIGVINIVDSLFAAPDLYDDKKLTRTYVPNSDQRFSSDVALYVATQRWMFNHNFAGSGGGLTSPTVDESVVDGALKFITAIMAQKGITLQDVINGHGQFVVMGNVFLRGGRLLPGVPGYSMNPITPTAAELASTAGLRDYYSRGGFLLSEDIATGKEPILSGVLLSWTSGYFRCGKWHDKLISDPGNQVLPYMNWPSGAGAGWTINQTTSADGSISLNVHPKDPGAKSKILSAAAHVMEELASMICSNQSVITNANAAAANATSCIDNATAKPCTAGAANCKCTKPSVTQQSAAGVGNGLVSLWCSLNPITNPPTARPVTPFVPPIAPDDKTSTTNWWLVGGLGLLGGIAASAFLAPPTTKK